MGPGNETGKPTAHDIMGLQYSVLEDFVDTQRRVFKSFDLMLSPPKVEVGATRCEEVYRKNRMRLFHYFPLGDRKHKTPLLVVYAVINRPYILDLQPDKSVIRRFLEKGFDVYLIDWGYPSKADEHTCTDDYIQSYIDPVVDFICERSGSEKISLLGYCIGGYFTTIYSALHPDKVAALLVMAATIDFDLDRGLLHLWCKNKEFDPQKVVDVMCNAPADFLNGGFLTLDPMPNAVLKYYNLFNNIDNENFVNNFLRMERWIKDGISIPGRFYVEFIKQGYQENRLLKGELSVEDKMIDLKDIDMPLIIITGKEDHLVPSESTKALAKAVSSKDIEILEFPTGHIGLSVSSRSHRELWPRVVAWLEQHTSRSADRIAVADPSTAPARDTPKKRPSRKPKRPGRASLRKGRKKRR
jgi:polyhydroxyalkanoate synthase